MYRVVISFDEDVPQEEEKRLGVFSIVQNLEQYYTKIIKSKPYSNISGFHVVAGKLEDKGVR